MAKSLPQPVELYSRLSDAGIFCSVATGFQYTYPIVLLFFFIAASSITASNSSASQRLRAINTTHDDVTPIQKHFFKGLSLVTALTFVGNSAIAIAQALVDKQEHDWAGKKVVVSLVGSFLVYCFLLDSKSSPTVAHLATWSLAILFEGVLIGHKFTVYTHAHREPTAGALSPRLRSSMTGWEIGEVVVDLVRILLLLAQIGFYFVFVVLPQRRAQDIGIRDQRMGLLEGGGDRVGSYGSVQVGDSENTKDTPPVGCQRTRVSLVKYIKGYRVLFPYLWPSKDRKLQLFVMLCFLLVVAQRIVNLLVPEKLGNIMDCLAHPEMGSPWTSIVIFVFLRFLQGSLLGAARSKLWIHVSQSSYYELTIAASEHALNLGLETHLHKSTDMLYALNKGANSINKFLEQMTFSMVPMLVDLAMAIGYFLVRFDTYYALVIAVVAFQYMYLTIRMAPWCAENRREMVNADRKEEAVKKNSTVLYEVVKLFNAERHEVNHIRKAVEDHQKADYKVMLSQIITNTTQDLIFLLGLIVICFIAAYQVVAGKQDVGKFVTLITYMSQLQNSLSFFGTFYRKITTAIIKSERMLELLKEQPTVVDTENARPLSLCQGSVCFNNVSFAYKDNRRILKSLNFRCEPGTITAFVGESGGGKSTVFRLLYRFYNIMSGNIQVDGHDVEDLTIDSVRSHIGVVPQDSSLFNETLMYNLKYANPDATDEQVYEACRAASIHDKIMTFPEKYQTKVGDRGLCLSGGEKQRVAIARTILKNPRIIMLDEATSALDAETEQHIQEALTKLAKGRTMLVIAHRLSTIRHADQILVLHEGKVQEQGTHNELLVRDGSYATMWKKQSLEQKN